MEYFINLEYLKVDFFKYFKSRWEWSSSSYAVVSPYHYNSKKTILSMETFVDMGTFLYNFHLCYLKGILT
jgi:hypothetical protein